MYLNRNSDLLYTLGNVVEEVIEQKVEQAVPGFGRVKSALWGPKRSDDIIEPTDSKNKAALQIMAEVRSYYDCK